MVESLSKDRTGKVYKMKTMRVRIFDGIEAEDICGEDGTLFVFEGFTGICDADEFHKAKYDDAIEVEFDRSCRESLPEDYVDYVRTIEDGNPYIYYFQKDDLEPM